MKTLAILQARMSSTRFPGKVLSDLEGKPMVMRQIERISRAATLDGIVVATSTDSTDDKLTNILHSGGIKVVRGDLDNVLERFIKVIELYKPDTVVRLTGDCPLASWTVIDTVVDRFHEGDVEYASNTLTPTYPDGLDVEVVRADVLRDVAATSQDVAEKEHVTLGVYRRPDRYRVVNVTGDRDLSGLRWTVDNPEDFAFVREIYRELHRANPEFDVPEILDYLERHPERSRTSADATRNAALKGLYLGAMTTLPED